MPLNRSVWTLMAHLVVRIPMRRRKTSQMKSARFLPSGVKRRSGALIPTSTKQSKLGFVVARLKRSTGGEVKAVRTRISTAQFERPTRGAGRRVDWPRADPRSLPHTEFDYDEGF